MTDVTQLVTQTSQDQIWSSVLTQLQLQMTRATFDTWFTGTKLVSARNGIWQVSVKNEFARDWLENRMANVVNQTVCNVAGHPVEIEYLVTEGNDAPVVAVETTDAVESESVSNIPWLTIDFAQEVDFEQLWQRSGFTQVPDYAIRFWRGYLGRAFDLWELLVSEDKRDVKRMSKGELPYWTLPRRYTYHGLAGALRCSRKTLTGRLVKCVTYEGLKKTALANQQLLPPAECCLRHSPTQWRSNSHNEHECVYWLEGSLERLYREGLLAVQRVQTPGKPRAHDLRLQIWRLLPLLTPAQVNYFPRELDREHHRDWLERYGPRLEINFNRWEQIPSPSLVLALPRYNEGRELHDTYLNNPFLARTQVK